MRRTIRKIRLEMPEEIIKADLARYCEEAIKTGATDSKVVMADKIPVDERAPLKCRVPICFGYGTCANCPPHTIKPSELKELLKKYRYAICLRLDVEPEVIVRNRETILERAGAYRKMFEMVSQIESLAFYDGHYFAVGFAAGSCKSTYCYKDDCAVLKGGRCRNELRARPSMEAVGIDVYRLATALGWDIYPIGSDCAPEDITRGSLLGLVVIC